MSVEIDDTHLNQVASTVDVAHPMRIDSLIPEQSPTLMSAINIVLNWINIATIIDVAQPMQLDASTPGPRLILTRQPKDDVL